MRTASQITHDQSAADYLPSTALTLVDMERTPPPSAFTTTASKSAELQTASFSSWAAEFAWRELKQEDQSGPPHISWFSSTWKIDAFQEISINLHSISRIHLLFCFPKCRPKQVLKSVGSYIRLNVISMYLFWIIRTKLLFCWSTWMFDWLSLWRKCFCILSYCQSKSFLSSVAFFSRISLRGWFSK